MDATATMLRARLVDLVGVDGRDALGELRAFICGLPGTPEDKAAAIDAQTRCRICGSASVR